MRENRRHRLGDLAFPRDALRLEEEAVAKLQTEHKRRIVLTPLGDEERPKYDNTSFWTFLDCRNRASVSLYPFLRRQTLQSER